MHTVKTLCSHSLSLRDGKRGGQGPCQRDLCLLSVYKYNFEATIKPDSLRALTLSVCIGAWMSLPGGEAAEVGAGDAAVAIMCNWTIYTQRWLWNQTTVYGLNLRWYSGRQGLFKAQLNIVSVACILLHFSEWIFKILFFILMH